MSMKCPRCGNEYDPGERFCTECGLPLTDSIPVMQPMGPKEPGKFGKFMISLGKAIAYVMLFFFMQTAVIGLYSAALTVEKMAGGMPSSGMDMGALTEAIMEAMMGDLALLTLISGVLTILFLAVFFALRRKKLFAECALTPVPAKAVLYSALMGLSLNLVLSVTISLLPLPEAWFAGLEDQYGALGETNILLELVSTALVTGLVEELVFRGLVFTRLSRGMRGWAAVLLSALIFGLLHGTPIAIGYATLLGIFFIVMDKRYGSILPSVVAHICFNGAAVVMNVEDTLLVFALYLILAGVFVGSTYLFFRREPDMEKNEAVKEPC